jgi:GNAT superfamily N-acetyltransferase
MLVFARHFYDSLPYADIDYDEDSCIAWLAIMRRDGVLLLAEADGVPVGMAGGIFSPFIFNINVRVGAELMWWIEPEHRGSGIGIELLKDMENAAYTAGARRWSMIAIEDTAERVSRIYDQMGYTASERTYCKVPKWRR